MKRIHFIALSLAVFLCTAVADIAAGDAETEAILAAEAWLGLVDAGSYGTSWEEAAALFKVAVTKESWERAVASARMPLGHLKSRRMQTATYVGTPPGAPDGDDVVIQFAASFANKKSAIETVTPMKNPDGT